MPSTSPIIVFNPARNTSYRLDFQIDRGGEGQVWAATEQSGLAVAIKFIHQTPNWRQAFNSWFRDQDIHLKCITHPNIVQTYDQFFCPTHGWIIVMERARCSLETVLSLGKPVWKDTVIYYGCQLLWGLHRLHTQGVIHRDIKPKNVLLFDADVVKLNDFGVAKTGLAAGDITRTILGTRQYLPPEFHKRGHWSNQSDIYQIGLILLSLLLGQHVIPPTASEADTKNMISQGIPRLFAENLIPTYGSLAQALYFMVCRTESLRYKDALSARAALWKAWTDPTHTPVAPGRGLPFRTLTSLSLSSPSRR